ncbi:hypothetical protein AKJ16_DCAP03017 [Drosera capensis]
MKVVDLDLIFPWSLESLQSELCSQSLVQRLPFSLLSGYGILGVWNLCHRDPELALRGSAPETSNTNVACKDCLKILDMQRIANQVADAFLDAKRVIKSHIPAVNVPVRIEIPKDRSIVKPIEECQEVDESPNVASQNDASSREQALENKQISICYASKDKPKSQVAESFDYEVTQQQFQAVADRTFLESSRGIPEDYYQLKEEVFTLRQSQDRMKQQMTALFRKMGKDHSTCQNEIGRAFSPF